MNDSEELKVDLNDPADVLAKLPQAIERANAYRQQASELVEKADNWDRLVHVLESVASPARNLTKREIREKVETGKIVIHTPGRNSTSGDKILTILEQAAGPVSSPDFRKLMPDTSPNTLNWKLSVMARDGQIKRLEPGVYAPISYEPEQASLPTGESTD